MYLSRQFTKVFFITIVIFFSIVPNALASKNNSKKLTILSYSSFADNWGMGRDIVKEFEQDKGVKVELLDMGSGFEFINSLRSGKTKADVAVGIDDSHIEELRNRFTKIIDFDYGYFAFVYDTRSKISPPSTLSDLAKSEYKNKFVIIDPRTSFVGFGLLRWAVCLYGEKEGFKLFNRIMENSLTVPPSWTVAYSLFTNGEVPMVLSYTTSPVYHYDNNEDYYTSLIFDDGNLQTREYACVFSDSKNKKLAEEFLGYIVRNSKDIAITNVMYPVNGEDDLPINYSRVKKPEIVLTSDQGDDLLLRWQETIN